MAKQLIYFDLKGLGESLRYILHYGGIKFEDVRIQRSDWPTKKNEVPSPFGKLPVLVDGDRILNQSVAIARYLGRGLGLVPADPWEEAAVDAVILTLFDFINNLYPIFREEDEVKKENLKKQVLDETMPYYFSRFEKLIKDNNGHIGKKLTWADFVFVGLVDFLDEFFQSHIEDKYPTLKGLVTRVHNLPGVKEYIATRKS